MMLYSGSYLKRLLPVFGANILVIVLAFVGLAILWNFSDTPRFILLFVVSLLQGGAMVRAFGPVVHSEANLSLGGQIVGWIGFLGWIAVHFTNAEMVVRPRGSSGLLIVAIETAAYLVINTLVLIPFYWQPIRDRRQQRRWAETLAESSARSISQPRRDPEADRRADQKRREAVRFACQMLYDRHRVQLREKFPPARLKSYFAQYMTDEHPVDEVERRGEQLQSLIREFLDDDRPSRKPFENLAQLDAEFRRQAEEIRRLECTDAQRDALLSDLEYEKARALRELRQT